MVMKPAQIAAISHWRSVCTPVLSNHQSRICGSSRSEQRVRGAL